MNIIISLRDNEDKCHDSVRLNLQDDVTVAQLQRAIFLRHQFTSEYQRIFDSTGRRIDLLTGSLVNAGLRDEENLVLKHSLLLLWEQYEYCVTIALKPGSQRMETAREAVRIHQRLMETGFFTVYNSFNFFRTMNHHKIASWTDGNIGLMKEATREHFLQQHRKNGGLDDKDFVCRFEVRPKELGGSRKNTLAFVKLHGQTDETKLNVKCHHFGSCNNSTRGENPDIREIFSYKLLELIHVGPQVQFILPNTVDGRNISLYIATHWNDNFTPLSSNTGEAANVEVLVEILLLGTFLFIGDLHADNCGYWKDTKKTAIVDFMPKGIAKFTNVKRALLYNESCVQWEMSHIDALEACDEATRLEMARKCLKKWDLLSKIDIANQQIAPEMDRMKQQQIGFKGFNSPTEELDQYIDFVKENLVKLSEFLRASE